jgi:LysM repeat protein
MLGRRPARLLAPMALIAFVVVLVVVIASAGGGGGSKSSSAETSRTAPTTGTAARRASRPRRYVVTSSDTSLDEIARKTGVPSDRLLELNPALDPQSLMPGQSLKLR